MGASRRSLLPSRSDPAILSRTPQAPAPPHRHVPHEPEAEHEWQEEEERLRDEEGQPGEDGGQAGRDPDPDQPLPAQLAPEPPALVGRDLGRVPAPAPLLARPALAVG